MVAVASIRSAPTLLDATLVSYTICLATCRNSDFIGSPIWWITGWESRLSGELQRKHWIARWRVIDTALGTLGVTSGAPLLASGPELPSTHSVFTLWRVSGRWSGGRVLLQRSSLNGASIVEAAGKMGLGLLNGSLKLLIRDYSVVLRSQNLFGVGIRLET